ncbi:related to RNA splicing factor PRP9 [Cephalotrichum gorgonifer]|uniref:Related to RNA splicing factor PRP9 n=1 Tax=Cephalotrichum gorgonifer TaxID=2041049 RepID=A0AAE8N4D9_9PEZI|nr:related to RNA splicing factor PRP9 [Cephalotrichum gorgonifer]
MYLEDQRYIHEDLERLEQAIADRIGDDPKHIRDRLNRDHEVAQLLDQIRSQSTNLLKLYRDEDGALTREIQQVGAEGDPFEEFYREVGAIRDHHARYPNEQAENAELRYRAKRTADGDLIPYLVDTLFSGEEAFGRFFDLHACHESYLNLPNVKRLNYLQYLEIFDNFAPGAGGIKRDEKLTDQYFRYLGELAEYLESFMRRTRPLENVDKIIAAFDDEFGAAWEKNEVEGWVDEVNGAANGAAGGHQTASADAVFCEDCDKEFKNENVYKNHLTGRKHIKAAEKRAERIKEAQEEGASGTVSARRMKEKAVAEREYRIKKLAAAMSTERADTKVNVERKQGMTERERQQELDNLMSLDGPEREPSGEGDDEDDEDGEEKIYNPLKLPLAWDGKPIPFWLYRLHGLGVEFPCEVCGNFVYMGRRAYDKHFNEARHIYGLRCLGITNTTLFRDISHIDEAMRLWEKIQKEEKKNKIDEGSVVQMEDAEGNVMPEKVYYDLQKQGLL